VSCGQSSDCPILVGTTCNPNVSGSCPTSAQCVQTGTDANGNKVFACQETCSGGQCLGTPCTTDNDCRSNPLGEATGTFLLCDNEAGSPTHGTCVSTNASLFANTGVNGASCDSTGSPSPSTLCGGCPTDPSNPLSIDWPKTPAGCRNNNPDWVASVQPELAGFKRACQTSYNYPYDDATTTFSCQNGASGVAYDVTFHPHPLALGLQ
jgi:hypothetical protein